MRDLISGRQEPQLVPQRRACCTAARACAPLSSRGKPCTTCRILRASTLKQVHTALPRAARATGGSRVADIYGTTRITERHRHRYEVNMNYRKVLEANGLLFSGVSPDGKLPEIVERTDHPWFIGVQFHPELKSKPFEPHPLFSSFIAAAVHKSRLF